MGAKNFGKKKFWQKNQLNQLECKNFHTFFSDVFISVEYFICNIIINLGTWILHYHHVKETLSIGQSKHTTNIFINYDEWFNLRTYKSIGLYLACTSYLKVTKIHKSFIPFTYAPEMGSNKAEEGLKFIIFPGQKIIIWFCTKHIPVHFNTE